MKCAAKDYGGYSDPTEGIISVKLGNDVRNAGYVRCVECRSLERSPVRLGWQQLLINTLVEFSDRVDHRMGIYVTADAFGAFSLAADLDDLLLE